VFCTIGAENGNPVLRESSNDDGSVQNEVGNGVLVKRCTEGEVDISEGVAIEMFGISVSEDEVSLDSRSAQVMYIFVVC